MKRFLAAAAMALTATSAAANIPTITLPDLTFPTPSPDVSTQDCVDLTNPALCN